MAFGGLGGATVPSLGISGFAPPVSGPSFTPGTASLPPHCLFWDSLTIPHLAQLSLGS